MKRESLPSSVEVSGVAGLPTAWRERAEGLRRYSVPASNAYEDAANELERALRKRDDDVLNLTQAAQESGYSADYLGKLVKAGGIENMGRTGAPKIRMRDLPRKAVKATGTESTFPAILRSGAASRGPQ